MKLSKLYSNNEKFKEIIFNPGFNVIFGDVESKDNKKGTKVEEHNIGKTSLVYLLNFMLLTEIKSKSFFGKYKDHFLGWIFYLEIELNDGTYLTVKRGIDNNTRISFKHHKNKDQNYITETNWDYEDISLTSKKLNAKQILDEDYLKFDINKEYGFRSFLSFLLRTQNDYQDVFRLDKFRGKDLYWKPGLFDVLGFDSSIITKKYELDGEIENSKTFIKKSLGDHSNDSKLFKIKAAIEAKKEQSNELNKKIKAFDFYKKEKEENYKIVGEVESKIATLNTERYNITQNIEKISTSLKSRNNVDVNIEKISNLYKEAEIYFPKDLLKDYKDVLNFTNQITSEREKYLKEELKELSDKLEEIEIKLKKNNNIRKSFFSGVSETDTFKKYNQYRDDLSRIDLEIVKLEEQENKVNKIEQIQDDIDEKNQELKTLGAELKNEISKDNADFQNIKKIFQNIYKTTFQYTALIVVEPNTKSNIEFEASVIDDFDINTGKGDGYTSIKVMCACFVLSVLINYSIKSFHRFAYHDGILESWGNGHKTAFVELIREYCNKYNIQYIMSVIKSDIPVGLEISEDEIVRKLSYDDTLFGFEW